MNCEMLQGLLSAHLEGELSPADRAECDAHLRTCPGCAALASAASDVCRAMAGFPEIDASPELLSRLRAMPEKGRKSRFRLDILLKPSLQPVYAAVTLLLVVFSLYAFSPQNRRAVNKAVSRQFHISRSRVEKLIVRAEGFTDGMGGYKDNVIDTLKSIPLLRKNEE